MLLAGSHGRLRDPKESDCCSPHCESCVHLTGSMNGIGAPHRESCLHSFWLRKRDRHVASCPRCQASEYVARPAEQNLNRNPEPQMSTVFWRLNLVR